MGESTILKVTVNQEEVIFLETTMTLEKKAGEHTVAFFTGILEPGKDGQENCIVPEVEIEIFDKGMEEVLFRGMVKTVEIGMETVDADPLKRVELELVSGTYRLERKKRDRAFQNTAMNYQAAAELILKNYKGAALLMKQGMGAFPLGQFIIQYQETDWMFLKRLMSRLNQPMIPDNTSAKPQIYVGVIGPGETYEIQPEEENQVQEQYYIEREDEGGHLEYLWTTEKSGLKTRSVGDAVLYRGITYYIKEARIQVQNSSIRHQYLFCKESGFRVHTMHNPYITGLSLPGTVEKVSGDQVQVKLDIDAVEEHNCWYTYSTFYSTFYCMPEIGDRVHLYIPGMREEQAFILNSIRDKVSGRESGGGSFQAGSASAGNESEQQEKHETNKSETNIFSWLSQLSQMPSGSLVAVGVGTSEIPEETQEQEIQEQEINTQKNAKKGAPVQASYSDNGTQSQVPEFDFQNLYNNEDIKVLSTRDKKMIILDDRNGSVSIRYSNGTYIVLKGDGIQINSSGYLHLRANGNISLTADGSMSIKADEQMMLGCKESSFLLTPDGIAIHGTDIKINE